MPSKVLDSSMFVHASTITAENGYDWMALTWRTILLYLVAKLTNWSQRTTFHQLATPEHPSQPCSCKEAPVKAVGEKATCVCLCRLIKTSSATSTCYATAGRTWQRVMTWERLKPRVQSTWDLATFLPMLLQAQIKFLDTLCFWTIIHEIRTSDGPRWPRISESRIMENQPWKMDEKKKSKIMESSNKSSQCSNPRFPHEN